MSKPNVILLTIDTLRADRLGCYGYNRPITPNLDRLASQSIRFSQAISGGSWTQASFPVIMTSTYASMYGGCLGPLSPERPSPVEALSAQGYATGAFSSSPLLSHTYGYHRGFDIFMDLDPMETNPPLRNVRGGQYLLRNPLVHYVSKVLGMNMRPARLYVSAEEVNQSMYQWLNDIEQPFFTWAHYMDVHWPYHLDEDLSEPRNIAQAWQDIAYLYRVNRQGEKITSTQKDYFKGLYDRAVRYTDEQIGQLLGWLMSSKFGENTIVIVVSDHGEEFLERKHWGHFETNLYDEIVRVPLIVRLPGQPGGQVVQKQVRTLDIMPTILDLCDCPVPAGVEGSSLVPLWKGDESQYEDAVSISERWRNQGDKSHIIALRTEAFKYIWYDSHPGQPALFDLRADPGEKNNVIAQYLGVADEFQSIIDQHLKRVAQTRPENDVTNPGLDKLVVERLRGLGYME